MPARVNTTGDIGTAKDASDAYDKDNIFLTDEGWVYRHFKKADKSQFWDEIIVAGEVDPAATIGGVANAPVDAINDATPTFETGDGLQDIEYSPDFNSGGGGAPTPPATGPATGLSITNPGSNYSVATGLATTGGNGNGLTVNVTSVAGGSNQISGVSIASGGSGYQQGDVVTVVQAGSSSDARLTVSI